MIDQARSLNDPLADTLYHGSLTPHGPFSKTAPIGPPVTNTAEALEQYHRDHLPVWLVRELVELLGECRVYLFNTEGREHPIYQRIVEWERRVMQ